MTALGRRAGGLPVLLLTAAFLCHGLFLAMSLPGGDPLDETFHFAYACFVAQTERVPDEGKPSIPAEFRRAVGVLPASYSGPRLSWRDYSRLPEERRHELRREAYEYRAAERQFFLDSNYETQQPPLFYGIAAPLLKLLPRARFSTRLVAVRVLSISLAAAAVPLAYVFFRRLLSKRSALAATAAFVAFPGVGVFVGRFTNDALALPIAAALLSLFVEAGRGVFSRGRMLALAALLAVGCWTKLYFLLLLPVAPLATLLTARGRRTGAWKRPALACAAALLLFLPWLIHQKAQTGDWFGLIFSKQATSFGIGLLERLKTLPGLFTPRFAIVFGRTFLWPGTRSAAGAPAALAVGLFVLLLLLAVLPNVSGGSPSRLREATWRAGGLAVLLFLLGQCAQAATYAAVGRLRGHAPSAGPDGWYLLLLFPVILSAGCAFGRGVPGRLFLCATALFLGSEWWMTFGVLPGVYGGQIGFNGSNAPFAAYGNYLLRPAEVLKVYERVGLAGLRAQALGLVVGLWLLLLASAVLTAAWPRLGGSSDHARRV
jgi:4-amino-4-deoxy-L-arabinose transferase-like glycosyltransferase